MGIAANKGLDHIYGTVLNENRRMLGLCRKLGFHLERQASGMTTVVSPLLKM